jgi:hypothetical protein
MKLVNINEVKPNPKNPRQIKDDKFKKLVKSIQEFPDMLNKRPLIVFTDVDNKYIVLGGNMRLKACKEVGIKEIPIIVADEWTEEQKNEVHPDIYKLFGTYPLDYNFKSIEPKYLIGMSVPPVMTAQIANQIKIQWLDNITVK